MDETVKLIEKFLSNTITEREKQKLYYAYKQKKISEKQFENYYEEKWHEASHQSSKLDEQFKEEAWTKFQKYIRQKTKNSSRLEYKWRSIVSVAAAAAVFFVLGFSINLININQNQDFVLYVENGQKASVQLPDGSHVQLNSASELRYGKDFGKKNRVVKLSGEAFFDVKSNLRKPFIVQTQSNLSVKALGTKFNVKSYPNENQVVGTLIEGSIEVSNSQFAELLVPNEKITFFTQNNTFEKSRVENVDESIFWMTDQFVFEGETLESIAKILERMYNVTISFTTSDIKDIQYSGKIKNNSMENVLGLITAVSPLQYTINGSQIIFTKK